MPLYSTEVTLLATPAKPGKLTINVKGEGKGRIKELVEANLGNSADIATEDTGNLVVVFTLN